MRIYRKEEMFLLKEDGVDEESLWHIFTENKDRVVYIVQHFPAGSKIIGIITNGDFRRNQLKGKILMNTRFQVAYSEEEAENIWNANPQIAGVPIVDNHGYILAEYVGEYNKDIYENKR